MSIFGSIGGVDEGVEEGLAGRRDSMAKPAPFDAAAFIG